MEEKLPDAEEWPKELTKLRARIVYIEDKTADLEDPASLLQQERKDSLLSREAVPFAVGQWL